MIAGSLIARDNSERALAADHVKLMLGELNHRVKNTLASVQAIALQTMFAVILVFMGATTLLHKTFPAPAEEEETEEDDD